MALDPNAAPKRGLAIASLVIGLLAIPTLGLLIVGGVAAIVLGVVALLKARREPAAYGGTGLAIGGVIAGALSLMLIPVISIVAAIAIPGLLGARTAANEVSTIANLRTILSGEAVFATSNGGAYGTLECLAEPASCGFDARATAFVPPELLAPTKSGYRLTFYKGAPADRAANPAIRAAPSFEGFAVVAEPEQPGVTGTRTFCTDATGVIRLVPQRGAAPAAGGGACPDTWAVLQ